jgi:cell division transport system ATP-binding protein
MLDFNNVTFAYPNQDVFKNLDLTINKGEFVFLIGKSGSGKTTLLQMVYMNLLPQEGYVEFAGYNSLSITPKKIPFLRKKIGVIFQDFKLLNDRNVYENLEFILRVTGVPRKQMKRKIYTVLTSVGLAHKQKNMPDQLSGGEKQRIAIARAVINQPDIILADEPTGNLDPATANEILEILRKINVRGTTVICATHNYKIVKKNNARIVKLENHRAFNVDVNKDLT